MKRLLSVLLLLILVFGVCSCGGSTGGESSGDRKKTEPASTSADSSDGSETPASAPVGTSDESDPSSSEPVDTPDTTEPAQKGEAKEFTSLVTLESDRVAFCLPEDRDGAVFTDMGANCTLYVDRYNTDVAAYYEYDDEGETVKKTVGDYTFDYQKFNHYGIEDWLMYVIRIAHNGDYYRFLYNVYAKDYDDAQVEKFMETIRFLDN